MEKKMIRINKLIEVMKSKNGATVRELAALMSVSEMTIRRDLKVLGGNGVVTNVYGSTFYNPTNRIDKLQTDYQLHTAAENHNEEKDRIGKFAATMVSPGDTIAIDTGSTTEALTRHMDADGPIQAICSNTNILNILLCKEQISVAFSGGFYHDNAQMFESRQSVEFIRSFRINKSFISASGVHETLGVTCSNEYEVATKQAIMDCGAEKILLADSSKFSHLRSAYFAPLSAFDTVITDSALSPAWQETLRALGITVYLV